MPAKLMLYYARGMFVITQAMSCSGEYNPLTNLKLYWLYVLALAIHVGLVAAHIGIIVAIPKARDACIPITYTYFTQRPGAFHNVTIGNGTVVQRLAAPSLGTADGPGICFVYVSLAFVVFEVACLAFFLGFWKTKYEQIRNQQVNPYRWIFYAISASLMLICILAITSVVDLGAILTSVGCNMAMMACGYWSECVNVGEMKNLEKGSDEETTPSIQRSIASNNLQNMPKQDKKQKYNIDRRTPFFLGAFLGFIPWISILHSYIRTAIVMQPPWFVHGFLWQLFFFFSLFAVVEWRWIMKKPSPFMAKCTYENKEWAYTFLSFWAKAILATLILSAAATM
jgi:hypothetical protein